VTEETIELQENKIKEKPHIITFVPKYMTMLTISNELSKLIVVLTLLIFGCFSKFTFKDRGLIYIPHTSIVT
jgi:hypothetical protein